MIFSLPDTKLCTQNELLSHQLLPDAKCPHSRALLPGFTAPCALAAEPASFSAHREQRSYLGPGFMVQKKWDSSASCWVCGLARNTHLISALLVVLLKLIKTVTHMAQFQNGRSNDQKVTSK